MEKLKPCPFCGGKAHVVITASECWIECDECFITTQKYYREYQDAKARAIRVWNKRNNVIEDRLKEAQIKRIEAEATLFMATAQKLGVEAKSIGATEKTEESKDE